MDKKTLEINTEKVLTVNKNGEILDEIEFRKMRFNFKEGEPKYIKLYFEDISLLFGISNGENKILLTALKKVEFGTNILMINKYIRTLIAEELDTTETTVRNAFIKFTKKGIVEKIATGIYRLNPYLFGSGTWKDIKGLRLTIEYTNKGKEIKTVEEIEE